MSDLFKAGIIPGLLIGFALMVYSWMYCKKYGEDKKKLNEYRDSLKAMGFLNLVKDSFLALVCPIIVLGSIYSGIASPTEAAVISVFYALILSVCVYKTLKIKDVWDVLVESVKTYSTILFIIAVATAFSRVLIFLKVPEMMTDMITGSVSSKFVLLILINLLLLFVGMIMDTTPAILILTPILLPIVQSYGMDQIHFGIMMVVNLAIGFVTPPLGVNLFVASTITNIKMEDIIQSAIPLIIAFMVVLVLITFIPQLSLALL